MENDIYAQLVPGSVIVILSNVIKRHIFVTSYDTDDKLSSGNFFVGGTYITKVGFTDMRNRKRSLHYVNVDTIVEVISPERVRYAYPHCQQRIPS